MLSKSRVKYIQSLYHKKFRDGEGLFVIEGPKIVNEFLELAPALIQEVYAVQDWVENNASITNQNPTSLLQTVAVHELQKISSLSTPNQVLALVKKQPVEDFSSRGRISIMLDDIQDPGNMGTIIRTADWFGIRDIVCSRNCADIYNSKVVQSTMGSILRVNVIYCDLLEWYSGYNDIPIYAAVLGGQSIKQMGPLPPGIMLIGNESRGVSDTMLKVSKEKIMIPRIGEAESLNAAVATGILLWHFCS